MMLIITISTGTVHTSTKARLNSVAIWQISMSSRFMSINHSPYLPIVTNPEKQSLHPDGDLDRHQNLIICSLAHCQPSLKISCKYIWKFLHKVVNRQTNNEESNLLGRGNNKWSKKLDKRTHRLHTLTVQLYSPDGANVHSIFYNGPPLRPSKLLFRLRIWTPSNKRFLGAPWDRISNDILIGSTVSALLTIMTDRLTDWQTTLLLNNRPHLCM